MFIFGSTFKDLVLKFKAFFFSWIGCGRDWCSFQSSCYRVMNKRMTYESAEQACNGQGSYLTQIKSAQENLFVGELLRTSTNGSLSHWWIGFKHLPIMTGDTWTNTAISTMYTNWEPSKRQLLRGSEEEKCATLSSRPRNVTVRSQLEPELQNRMSWILQYYWYAFGCNARLRFICQKGEKVV